MPKAELLEDREFERDYLINNKRVITIIYDEFDTSFSFKENGRKIGDEFRFIDEFEEGEKYLLARMYSPIPKSGLGQAALEFFIDLTGAIIYTRPNDGITRDDGSHLTEDAPFFVGKMQKKGLIEPFDEF